MSGAYTISVDLARSLISIELKGFFSSDEIEAFDAERKAACLKLRSTQRQHVTLVDLRSSQIQAQDAVNRFAACISDPVTASRKIAFLIAPSLARLQVKRTVGSRDAAYFLTREEAESWLFSEG